VVFGLIAIAAWILIARACQAGKNCARMAEPGIPGVVLAGGFYLAMVAPLGLGLGVIMRSTAAAIAAAVATLPITRRDG
jgi:hypothetical protein